jgi:hypothetical protein
MCAWIRRASCPKWASELATDERSSIPFKQTAVIEVISSYALKKDFGGQQSARNQMVAKFLIKGPFLISSWHILGSRSPLFFKKWARFE